MSIDNVTFGPWKHLGREVEIPQCGPDGGYTRNPWYWSSDGRRVEIRGWIKAGGWATEITHYCLVVDGAPKEFWVTVEESAPFLASPVRGDEFAFEAKRPFGTPEYLKERGIVVREEAQARSLDRMEAFGATGRSMSSGLLRRWSGA